MALKYLQNGGESDCFNIGSMAILSVKDIILSLGKMINKSILYKSSKKVSWITPQLVVGYSKSIEGLGFTPIYSDINTIFQSSWEYEMRF